MLRPSPQEFFYEDITVVFDSLIDGDPAKGFMPAYHYRIIDSNSNDVGHTNFRIGDSEHIRKAAGHIGFEVKAEYRGHRFAKKACLALAPWVRELSETVIITADPDNLPSIKTIEAIGALFDDEVSVPPNDPHYKRGSRLKRRYLWKPNPR